jgi:maltose O-acetyltransferase
MSFTELTEKEKMLAGELYQAFDPVLLEERNRANQICFELNHTSPLDSEKRKELTSKLFGRSDVLVESPFYCDYGYNLKVGANFYANHGCTILDCNVISVGDNCLLAPHVVISAATHPLDAAVRVAGDELTAPITIGNNCWFGASSTINPGVTLGDNVVVGAGAVVTKSFPDNVVIAGVPAKIIRYLNEADEPVSP